MSKEIWIGALLGAILGSIIIPFAHFLINKIIFWWKRSRPALRLLEGVANQDELCKIFVRDLVLDKDSKLISIEPRAGAFYVPNIPFVWPDVEGKGATGIFNVLGQVNKTENIEIVYMSQDVGEWDNHVIVLGAQANKCYDFYKLMKNVAYTMDSENIFNNETKRIIIREEGFGYGIILKSHNPYKTSGEKGIGFLIGGYCVLGTAAAGYYFKKYFRLLGKEFGNNCFGIVVRAPISAGEEAVERLKQYDIEFKDN